MNRGNVKIAQGAIVCCEQTKITGDVTIGSKTIVHPTAVIHAEKGPIVIGSCNLIEEFVQIINKNPEPMVIGSYNVLEVGSYTESMRIGDHNVLESKCRIGPKCLLTTGCVVGAKCCIMTHEELVPNTIIYGKDCSRRVQFEKPASQTHQLEFLTKILPNYQKLEKANIKATEIMPPVTSNLLTPNE